MSILNSLDEFIKSYQKVEKIMLAGTIENKKQFMSLLLKGTSFDRLLVRSVTLRTSVLFEIDCTLDKNWFDVGEAENMEKYALWSDIKPVIFELIKGHKLPGYMKIILSPASMATEKIHNNAAALFININFENNILTITTGCSEKIFSMDRSVERIWDEYASKFFKNNGIILE